MIVKSKKEFFNKFFIVIAIVNFVVIFSVFSFFNSQISGFKKQSVAAKDDGVLTNEQALQLGATDPFITPGLGVDVVLEGPILDGYDPEIGPSDAPVTIVEFSDFSCEFCAQQEKNIKEIMDKYKGKVRLIWKDFPDMQVNSYSFQASLAARCAKEQGKFWEFHDLLYADGASSTLLSTIAQRAGLDTEVFKECVLENRFANDIESNLKEAAALRLPGAPFFFVNGREYLGSIDKEDLELILSQNE